MPIDTQVQVGATGNAAQHPVGLEMPRNRQRPQRQSVDSRPADRCTHQPAVQPVRRRMAAMAPVPGYWRKRPFRQS